MLKVIANNTVSQVATRIVSSGTNFIFALGIARYFGVSGYGDIAKITAFVSIFYLVSDFGFNAIYLQFEHTQKRLENLFTIRLFLSMIAFLVILLLLLLLPYSFSTGVGYSPFVKLGIILFSVTLFTQAITITSAVLFQKELSYHKLFFATLAGSLVTLLGMGAILFFHFPLIGIVAIYVLSAMASTLASWMLAGQSHISFSLDRSFTKELFLQTLPITIMLVVNLVYFRVDMILLTFFKPTHDVAIYDFAYRFFDFLIALPLFLSNSLYPYLLRWGKNYRTQLKNISLYTTLFFVMGFLIAIPVWFLTPLLSLIRPEFAMSSFALKLLVLSLPIFFATNILQWVFIARKQQRYLVFVYASSLIANVLLNLLFIPHYSYVASAIITGVSEGFVLISLLVYSLISFQKSNS